MSIKNLIQDIEIKKLKEEYNNNKELLDIVSEYIKEKKLILYGGYALNLILPENIKIYKDYTQADYDCYSYDAKKHIIQLGKKLKKLKYKLIKVKLAKHENTFKLYVGTLNVLDLTQLDKSLFDIMIKIHLYEKYEGLIKYYKDNYNIVPLYLLKRNMHYELARPYESYYRWEKIESRLKLLTKVYFNKEFRKKRLYCENPNKKTYHKTPEDLKHCLSLLLNYVKENKNPIIDSLAIKLLKNIKNKDCCRLNKLTYLLMILSTNYKSDCNNTIKIIKKNINLDKYELIIRDVTDSSSSVDILKDRTRIALFDKINKVRYNLLTIIKVKDNCFSIMKKGEYIVGTVDTILCYLYSFYLSYFVCKYKDYRHNSVLEDTQQYIDLYENYIKSLDTLKRYNTECYGKQLSKQDIYEKLWKKKLSILKI
jgi:hypothetical protein